MKAREKVCVCERERERRLKKKISRIECVRFRSKGEEVKHTETEMRREMRDHISRFFVSVCV